MNVEKSGAVARTIQEGKTYLGIELGSTRIKAVLIDEEHRQLATGSYEWENRLKNGIWTYELDDVWRGLQGSFQDLTAKISTLYAVGLEKVGAIGISGMMHGYLAFDSRGDLLSPFRTWRNTNAAQAAAILSNAFAFNIPLRWSVAHLYQAILDGEAHVREICYLTTLAGYLHWKLSGEKVLGIGDASGMFPIDSKSGTYRPEMLEKFEELVAEEKLPWQLKDILPRVLRAGENAGCLTAEGARLLDPSGRLNPGILLCAPEGDASTGMVATDAVAPCTGNVSAGTSIFAMVVLEKQLSRAYPEIDMVTTPSGSPVAMVHCNNCTSDIDAWVKVLGQAVESLGLTADKSSLYRALFRAALEGEADCGGILSYNYLSGEPITGLEEGRPLLVRETGSRFSFANFAKNLLYSILVPLKLGLDILTEQEAVSLKKLMGHGGLFKVPEVGQRIMASALNTEIAVMESAGEGGAWGIAVLAAFHANQQLGLSLEDYLSQRVFLKEKQYVAAPDEADRKGFLSYTERYRKGLSIERAAVDHLT